MTPKPHHSVYQFLAGSMLLRSFALQAYCEDEHHAVKAVSPPSTIKNGVQNQICFKHLDKSPKTKNHVKELHCKCNTLFLIVNNYMR
jgi:hypothetical protein